jgi:pimeloyl-ACP methyl ester carboxylesterase
VTTADAELDFLAPRHDVPASGRSGFMIVDGRQVHYLEWGGGAAPPVVCLHGGGQTAYMWEELGAALAPTHHVFAPDLPGHGDTDPVDAMDRHSLAATVPPLLDEFGIGRAAFVGASLGGIISLTLAADRSDLFAAIALIDIGHRLEDEGVNRIIDFMTRHDSFASPEEAAVAVAEYLPHRRQVNADNLRRNLRQRPDGRWVWKHMFARRLRGAGPPPGGWRELVAGMGEEAMTLTCPVLVLRGAASDVLSNEGAEEIASLIPDARLATVGSAGHHAAGDNPETIVDLVRHFLAETGW